MHRIGAVAVVVLGIFMPLVLVSAQQTLLCCTDSSGGTPCDYVGYESCLDTPRLVLSDTPIKEIGFGQDIRISHGWAFFFPEERQAMPPEILNLPPCEVVRLLLPYCRYQLTIDGSLVEPSFIGLLDIGDCWHLAPYYMLPGGCFAPGVHVLTLTRTISKMPVLYRPGWADMADEQGLVTWAQTHTLTLVVTY